jgi:tetratricopeptide (TPR) repeat protein
VDDLTAAQNLEREVKARFGINHAKYGQALNNLAVVYDEQGKYAEAEGLFKRALTIREQAVGANHPDVAETLNNLANVFEEQGKYGEAEGLYKRVLAIYEQALGANHPNVADPLNNLALVFEAQGKYAEAEGLYKRALAIREQARAHHETSPPTISPSGGRRDRNSGRIADCEGASLSVAAGAHHRRLRPSRRG